MYVRAYDLDAEVSLAPMEQYLIENGIASVVSVGLSRILSVPFVSAFDAIRDDILHNKARKIATYKGQNG